MKRPRRTGDDFVGDVLRRLPDDAEAPRDGVEHQLVGLERRQVLALDVASDAAGGGDDVFDAEAATRSRRGRSRPTSRRSAAAAA
jgi:hypothetical protein